MEAKTVQLMFYVAGESVVFYLYLRYRFHWDEKQFSNYSAYKVLAGLAGNGETRALDATCRARNYYAANA